MYTTDCANEISSDKYRSRVTTRRNVAARSFTVSVDVMERSDARPVIPSEFTRPGSNNALVKKIIFFLSPRHFFIPRRTPLARQSG